jgi:hypothetical protein
MATSDWFFADKGLSRIENIYQNILIKTITSDLKVSTYIITSIQVHPFGLDAILVVMSVSTVITTVILYIFAVPSMSKMKIYR